MKSTRDTNRTRRSDMLSKFSLSLTVALALSAGAVRAALAAPVPTSTDEAREMSGKNDGEIDNPDSTEYKDRGITGRPSTNDQINAAESASPDSVDNKDQQRLPSGKNWRAD
jgi:hypothetical protein